MAKTGSDRLAFSVSSLADGVELAVAGELDVASADSLMDQAIGQLHGRPSVLTIDLDGVGFCDSAGINALIKIRNRCEEARWGFRVINPQPNVRRVLVDLTGLGDLLNIAPRE